MRPFRFAAVLASLAGVLFAAPAGAAEEEADTVTPDAPRGVEWFPSRVKSMPCRPTIACNADIVPEGAIEIEGGYTYIGTRRGNGLHASPFLLKMSVLPWLQLQAGGNGQMVATGADASRHFDDVSAGLKVRFIQQDKYVPAIGMSVHGFAPTAAAVGYIRDYDASTWLYVSKDIGPFHADFNVAAFAHAVDRQPEVRELVTLAVSADLPLHLTPMVEAYRFGSSGEVASKDGGFLFGLAYSPKPWLVFDVAGDASFYPEVRTFTTQAGMTIVPADLWEGATEKRERLARRVMPMRTATSVSRP